MIKRSLIVALMMGILPCVSLADVMPGSLFQDHMILQREQPVPVWGTADPNTVVTVEFAGQKKSAVTGADGKWTVTLKPLKASFDSRVLTISGDGAEIKIDDVLVGEVWICSGQSNMAFKASPVPELRVLFKNVKNMRNFVVKNTVSLKEEDRCEGAWAVGHPNSAVAFGFAYFLEEAIDAPVGIILTSWGSSSIEAWMPRSLTEKVPHFKTMMDEFDADAKTQAAIKKTLDGPRPWSKGEDVFLRRQSNILYNAMMKPLVPFACRGLVWYQGERNTQSMEGMLTSPWFSRNSGILKYGDTMKAWMKEYRELWGRDDFEFMVVMLPGYFGGKPLKSGPQLGAEHPATHSWAWMREQQLSAMELKNVNVVNTIDLGDIKNIHPLDKAPVGQRLALMAQRETLGMKVEARGPVLKKVKAKKNAITVYFDHADGLKTKDGNAPRGFWVSDDSKEWKQADAVIDGKTVVLTSAEVATPLYVRYAFAGMPKVNLINGAELPAYPFRTDRFEP